ncbi:uncharacterized protein LOC131616936 [Vicia villosa]|uniref:uncharacterized protein LOC131616936 n=1 Tax=Vicia villosa TaxID=3911 RepID=UPI00273C3D64|nr:uncharacterized protein LOC131616936 [Vicia villosa]
MIGSRDISDHCPVWLIINKEDWGPKPFLFNNEWFSDKDFIPFVKKEWLALKLNGRGDFVLKEKLRLIKDRLTWWNKNIFGKYDLEVEEGVRVLNASDDNEGWDEEEQARKSMASKKIWLNLKIKENMLIQKAKLKWLNDGDNNSKYFHRVLKDRRNRNHISNISTSGGLVESVKEVKEAVKTHFEEKFKEEIYDRPTLDGIFLSSLSLEERSGLEDPFTELEVKEAVWNCDGSKSPGPDGFSLLFFKRC